MAATELLVGNIEEIVVIAEETASGAQQVASTTQALTSSMERFSSKSQSLNGISRELGKGVSAFKLTSKKSNLRKVETDPENKASDETELREVS